MIQDNRLIAQDKLMGVIVISRLLKEAIKLKNYQNLDQNYQQFVKIDKNI